MSGSVVFHIDNEVMENGRISHGRLKALGRLAGSDYCRTTELLTMERPKRPKAG